MPDQVSQLIQLTDRIVRTFKQLTDLLKVHNRRVFNVSMDQHHQMWKEVPQFDGEKSASTKNLSLKIIQ